MEVLCPNTDLKLNLLRSVLKKNILVVLDSWYEAEYLRTNKKKKKKKSKAECISYKWYSPVFVQI